LPLCCDNEPDITPDDPENSNFNQIIFRSPTGEVSEVSQFVKVDYARNVIKPDIMPDWVQRYPDNENTYFSIGSENTIVRDYTVQSIVPSGDEFEITGITYDERVFDES
jgi:hypothetical protein